MSWLQFFGYDPRGKAEKKRQKKEDWNECAKELVALIESETTQETNNMLGRPCPVNRDKNCFHACVHFALSDIKAPKYDKTRPYNLCCWYVSPYCKLWGKKPRAMCAIFEEKK